MSSDTALVIGEALVDIVDDGRTVADHPGGSPTNVAVGLARLGREVELATWIAPDERGRSIQDHLAADGVGLAPASLGAEHTSTATATLAADGAPSYDFDIDWALPSVTLPDDCRVVHTGSLAAALAPGREVVLDAVRRAAGRSSITFDPNVRADLLGSPAAARELIERYVKLADVVKASDEDLAWLGEGADPEEVLRGWVDLGPRIVVMTRGAHGVVAMTSSGLEVMVPSEPTEVVDTVGAGDSFMSGLIDGLWSAGLLGAEHRDELGRISPDTLRSVLGRAAHIAAITVSRAGANPPRIDELD